MFNVNAATVTEVLPAASRQASLRQRSEVVAAIAALNIRPGDPNKTVVFAYRLPELFARAYADGTLLSICRDLGLLPAPPPGHRGAWPRFGNVMMTWKKRDFIRYARRVRIPGDDGELTGVTRMSWGNNRWTHFIFSAMRGRFVRGEVCNKVWPPRYLFQRVPRHLRLSHRQRVLDLMLKDLQAAPRLPTRKQFYTRHIAVFKEAQRLDGYKWLMGRLGLSVKAKKSTGKRHDPLKSATQWLTAARASGAVIRTTKDIAHSTTFAKEIRRPMLLAAWLFGLGPEGKAYDPLDHLADFQSLTERQLQNLVPLLGVTDRTQLGQRFPRLREALFAVGAYKHCPAVATTLSLDWAALALRHDLSRNSVAFLQAYCEHPWKSMPEIACHLGFSRFFANVQQRRASVMSAKAEVDQWLKANEPFKAMVSEHGLLSVEVGALQYHRANPLATKRELAAETGLSYPGIANLVRRPRYQLALEWCRRHDAAALTTRSPDGSVN